MKKTYENTIPTVFAKTDVSMESSLYGNIQVPKRCRCCRMSNLKGVEYYQPTDAKPSGYAVCKLCYKLKLKYSEMWKHNKMRIMKELWKNHIENYSVRARVFEEIFRNGGYDNHFS